MPRIDLARVFGTVSLAQWQTGFRNQTGRGSCFAFAAVAAMEAMYHRQHGVVLDLSEQFAFHLNKAGELYPNYESSPLQHENNSSYWGFQGSSDVIEKLARSSIPDELAAPYLLTFRWRRCALPLQQREHWAIMPPRSNSTRSSSLKDVCPRRRVMYPDIESTGSQPYRATLRMRMCRR
ncbi:C1 family peptidase [Rhodococcus koreensis]